MLMVLMMVVLKVVLTVVGVGEEKYMVYPCLTSSVSLLAVWAAWQALTAEGWFSLLLLHQPPLVEGASSLHHRIRHALLGRVSKYALHRPPGKTCIFLGRAGEGGRCLFRVTSSPQVDLAQAGGLLLLLEAHPLAGWWSPNGGPCQSQRHRGSQHCCFPHMPPHPTCAKGSGHYLLRGGRWKSSFCNCDTWNLLMMGPVL